TKHYVSLQVKAGQRAGTIPTSRRANCWRVTRLRLRPRGQAALHERGGIARELAIRQDQLVFRDEALARQALAVARGDGERPRRILRRRLEGGEHHVGP